MVVRSGGGDGLEQITYVGTNAEVAVAPDVDGDLHARLHGLAKRVADARFPGVEREIGGEHFHALANGGDVAFGSRYRAGPRR